MSCASEPAGGAIYTLGAQGNLPFEMPAKYHNTSVILPPSMQQGNHIHDAGNKVTAALDHDGIGEGCHCPGGLYSDEGTVNTNACRRVFRLGCVPHTDSAVCRRT